MTRVQPSNNRRAGIFEVADHVVGERRADVAVDDAVIEREREQHHVADHDLTVAHDGLCLIWCSPRMPTFGKLMIGVANRPACLPSEVMVKVEPLRSSRVELARARGGAEPLDLERELEQAPAIGVADHRHDQALLGRGGDADVVAVVQHELVASAVSSGC